MDNHDTISNPIPVISVATAVFTYIMLSLVRCFVIDSVPVCISSQSIILILRNKTSKSIPPAGAPCEAISLPVMEFIRDTPFGQLVRWLSGNRLFLFPEERPGFIVPTTFFVDGAVESKVGTAGAGDGDQSDSSHASNSANFTFLSPNTADNEMTPDIEKARGNSATNPEVLNDAILVGWYSPEDSDNPQNWSRLKKLLVALQIWYVDSTHTDFMSMAFMVSDLFLLVFTRLLSTLHPLSMYHANRMSKRRYQFISQKTFD